MVLRYVAGLGVPNGIRTRVAAVKGRSPGPLDDGDAARQEARQISRAARDGQARGAALKERCAAIGRGGTSADQRDAGDWTCATTRASSTSPRSMRSIAARSAAS